MLGCKKRRTGVLQERIAEIMKQTEQMMELTKTFLTQH